MIKPMKEIKRKSGIRKKSPDKMFKDLGYTKTVDQMEKGDEDCILYSKPIDENTIKYINFVGNECCVYAVKISNFNVESLNSIIDKPLAEAIFKKLEELESKFSRRNNNE